MAGTTLGFGHRVLRFISLLLKSLWLFFPGILFLLLTIFVFWSLGQGKDIFVAFKENETHRYYSRIIFFLAIGFWAYVSWYSSRINSYIKRSKQEEEIQHLASVSRETANKNFEARQQYVEINNSFLEIFPRIIGNGCFIILELSVLQLPILENPLNSTWALGIFAIALILLRYINRWIMRTQSAKPTFRIVFWIVLSIFGVALIVVSLFGNISILALLGLLLLLHIVFIYYTNLRRFDMEKDNARISRKSQRSWWHKLMDYFCVPRKESGYLQWYLYIGLLGLLFYILAINSPGFARGLGPFPFIILAFGVLLAFGNIVSAFSIKYSINFHFLLLVLALLFGLGETHYVRTVALTGNGNEYASRPGLRQYLTTWLNDRNVLNDSTTEGYDMYFVMANGGASRSGYWTSAVLGRIEDSTLMHDPLKRFSDHVFCLSGTSGGGVGVATFFSLLRDKEFKTKPIFDRSARDYLKRDYFTYTFAHMLGPDFFNYIFHIGTRNDRAAALEMSFENTSRNTVEDLYQVPFYDTFSKFPALVGNHIYLPVLCVNTTRMQDGNPGVVTNLQLDSGIFNRRVDVLSLLDKDEDISITTAAILGARFPYLSPAGRIGDSYFVDGGYFDNSGAGVVQEMIRGIMNIGLEDSIRNGAGGRIYSQVKKINFRVLHITNSPVDLDSSNIKPVAPIRNDLAAPLLTIIGAYDMQTTVNDSRLINFLREIDSFTVFRANYTQIPLYKEAYEWVDDPLFTKHKKEPAYAMNWFMSDTTRNRIDKRLFHHRKLDSLIRTMLKKQGAIY